MVELEEHDINLLFETLREWEYTLKDYDLNELELGEDDPEDSDVNPAVDLSQGGPKPC